MIFRTAPVKKYLKHQHQKQIWRILISETDKLLIEERNMETKEVFFSCYDLTTKENIFSELQFEQKSWIGIEAMENDSIIFHFYRKPDMPQHKGFFVFSMKEKKILWQNDTYAYFFSDEKRIVAFLQQFEGKLFTQFDLLTGEVTENYGDDFAHVNFLKQETDAKKSYGSYAFPEVFNPLDDDPVFDTVRTVVSKYNISGQVELIEKAGLLYFSFHEKRDDIYTQHFYICTSRNGSVLCSDILNKSIPKYAVDSFFLYKSFLLLMKEKQSLEIYSVHVPSGKMA